MQTSMTLSNPTKLLGGIMLLTVPTIEFGGTFLLRVLVGQGPELSELQKALFRAGHAHAGVLVILGLLAQLFADHAKLPARVLWATRICFIAAPILISGGFFGAGANATEPHALIALLWIGVPVLAFGLVALGVGLIRART